MTVAIRSILYCTDLSGNAEYAFEYVVALAQALKADIHILHVSEKLSSDAQVTLQAYIMDSGQRQRILEERFATARGILMEQQEKFWAGVPAEVRKTRDRIKSIDVIESYPAEQILQSAEKFKCDMIIMGAHEKGLVHNFLGGVVKSVMRRARVPTLVVPLKL